MKASAQSSRSFFCMGVTYTYNKFFSCHRQSFRAPFGEGAAIKGIDTYAKHVCRRRRDGGRSIPLFVLFVLFGQAKRTLKEKNHK